jgi:hypothetical protein
VWRDIKTDKPEEVEYVMGLVEAGKLRLEDLLDDKEFLDDEAFEGLKAVTRAFVHSLDAGSYKATVIKMIALNNAYLRMKSVKNNRIVTEEGKTLDTTFQDVLNEEVTIYTNVIERLVESSVKGEATETILPLLRTVFPHKYFLGNSLVSNSLINNQMAFDFTLQPIKEQKRTQTLITLSEDWGEDSVHYSRVITAKDNDVLDAVTNLIVAGNEQITPEAVYRFMHGHNKTQTASKQAIGQITKRIDKLKRTFINIDFTAEARIREKNDTITNAIYEGYLLPLEKMTVVKASNTKGGVIKTGYRALGMPPLYNYANYLQRVISVDTKILELDGVNRNASETFTAIKFYLVRRIEQMKNPKNKIKNNTILYSTIEETIFEKDTQLSRKERANIREDVKAWLTKWRDIDGYIKGFTENTDKDKKTGNSGKIVSVDIIL